LRRWARNGRRNALSRWTEAGGTAAGKDAAATIALEASTAAAASLEATAAEGGAEDMFRV
jgi:hypothetical protein